MSVATPMDFALTLISWALVGAMLAVLYDQIGPVTLIAFVAPALLGRQTLARSQMFLETIRAYRSREAALQEMSYRISQERSDERRLIAADLHDEVLQPLFKVTLLAQVLKNDLGSGQLLEMEDDLPELLSAAELAASSLRELIGDLRRSSIVSTGLPSAIRSLVRTAAHATQATIELEAHSFHTDEANGLVIYHLVREALTNAVRHSHASHIWVEIGAEEAKIHLSVKDDGRGFDPLAEHEGHYGIQIMRERAHSVGGELYVDSAVGAGTLVTAILPTEAEES